MASRIEIFNDGGFRSDGRRQYELRDISIDLSNHGSADGSVTIRQGLTHVLVSVFGPHEARVRSQTLHDRANLNVEVNVSAFSAGERRKRSRADKRLLELAATIRSTFEPVIQTHLYPRSQIDVFVQVIQQDGGLLQTCINGTTLALAHAGIPLFDFVCAVTGGVHSSSPMLDLTTLEENDIPNFTVAIMPKSNRVTLVAMETRLHIDRFEELFLLAVDAGNIIHKEMKIALQARTNDLATTLRQGSKAMGGFGERGAGIEHMDET
ncbi:exoribonuclease, exosome component 4 [Serpula lacrymans var. lacrymans S7.9]|uniref:Ribosomal RNA-processing protein 41 n=1 Tax=Serpula lacrymans var. lacrymans (strain S7.9) TaxID=578457 RepID=F8NXB5_SERL9|nr:exoribonuclease, exosome component 4 [Serpula lacrymans var. lacrymans S7.9]EGO25086.1 exoribonuclease, exosome component 4 [Serpula lacrymans var. lacrymans S7.9]